MQVCIGTEHGVLLTNQGTVFTWGDNRYGQLGRSVCKLREGGQPFHVPSLMDEEIVQVAAGTHHCLALSASSYVWAWGRNKEGQLGSGDVRDKIVPNKVRSELPDNAGCLAGIVAISAGGNSSVAAAANSDVLQWGEISSDFKQEQLAVDKASPQKTKVPVSKMLPSVVFRKSDFFKRVRASHRVVSVTETGCRVFDEKTRRHDRDQLADLLRTVRKWQGDVASKRGALSSVAASKRQEKNRRIKTLEASNPNDVQEIKETIGTLDRDINLIDREIYLLHRNMESIEVQQRHIRDQIVGLSGQLARLNAKDTQIQILMGQEAKGDKSLDKEASDIRMLLDSNHSTRASLLEQRSETDKEKHRISVQLADREKSRNEQTQRLQRIKELQENFDKSIRSDALLRSVRTIFDDILSWGPSGDDGHTVHPAHYVNAMLEQQDAKEKATMVERRLEGLVDSQQDPVRKERAEQIASMIRDLVQVHRMRMSLRADKLVKNDLDVSQFFKEARGHRDHKKASRSPLNALFSK